MKNCHRSLAIMPNASESSLASLDGKKSILAEWPELTTSHPKSTFRCWIISGQSQMVPSLRLLALLGGGGGGWLRDWKEGRILYNPWEPKRLIEWHGVWVYWVRPSWIHQTAY